MNKSLLLALAVVSANIATESTAGATGFGRLYLHPNGCVYVAAGAAGGQSRWYNVVNGHTFFPGARTVRSCPVIVAPVPGAQSVGG